MKLSLHLLFGISFAMEISTSSFLWSMFAPEKPVLVKAEVPIKVAVIGCGPIGLWTAIQVKLYKPEWDIVAVDKYPTFQRKHRLIVSPSSYKRAHTNTHFQEFIKSIPLKPTCNGLQEILLEYALGLGIKQEIHSVENVLEYVKEYHPDAKYIIGADGAHSLTRSQIFGEELKSVSDIQFLIELKYSVAGETSLMDTISLYKTQKLVSHLVTESVHPAATEDGEGEASDVSLRFIVDKEVFDGLSHATFKSPIYLKDMPELDTELNRSIQLVLGARQHMFHEKIIPGTGRLTSIKLKRYASNTVCKKIDEQTFILVGDAAFGVPFFRSLNNGLLCGSYLAAVLGGNVTANSLLTSSLWYSHEGTPSEPPFQRYESYVAKLSNKESLVADLKGSAVESYRMYASVSGQVPWQVVYWSEADKTTFLHCKFEF